MNMVRINGGVGLTTTSHAVAFCLEICKNMPKYVKKEWQSLGYICSAARFTPQTEVAQYHVGCRVGYNSLLAANVNLHSYIFLARKCNGKAFRTENQLTFPAFLFSCLLVSRHKLATLIPKRNLNATLYLSLFPTASWKYIGMT